jgi:hypothetical protein
VNEHQRIGVPSQLRGDRLYEGLTLHDLLARLTSIFASYIEIGALADCRLIDGGDRQRRRLGCSAGERHQRKQGLAAPRANVRFITFSRAIVLCEPSVMPRVWPSQQGATGPPSVRVDLGTCEV